MSSSLKRSWLACCLFVVAMLAFGAMGAGCLSSNFTPEVNVDAAVPSQDAGQPGQHADGSVSGPDASHGDTGGGNEPTHFTIGGTVSGLTGKGLVLQDNGGDDLAVSSDGAFTFAKPVAANGAYFVSISAQPSSPTQTCVVSNGSGTATSNVTGVQITCTTKAYSIGGTVVGLANPTGTGGSPLTLANATTGGHIDTVTVAQNGTFTFPANVASGSAYTVTVQSNPTSPAQTCNVSGGSGTVVTGAVTSIVVNCATNAYVVGGTVSGLAGQGLVLSDGTGTVALSANGSFALPTPIASGAPYAITVAAQPTDPSQTCTLTGGSGTMGSANVTTVQVACVTNTFPVGGTISGLAGAGLVLTSGGETLAANANGAFAFATSIASGDHYAVTVQAQPTNPWQTCTVAGGSGAVGNGAVTSIQITCVTNGYAVGGVVSGLIGSGLLLTMNGGSPLAIAADGPFAFPANVDSGATYEVSVAAQPGTPNQTCTVTNDQGTVAGSAIANVRVTCDTNTYPVGGTVNGLLGSGLVLTNDSGDSLTIPAGTSTFTFASPVASGRTYDVAVATQPSNPTQSCSVSGGQGTVVGGAVTGVAINCATNAYALGGTVSGLAGSGLVLQNGSATVSVNANGTFAFAAPFPSGASYAVTVATQPSAPTQSCSVTNGAGTVGSANVTSVKIVCSTTSFSIGGTVSNLAGKGLVLENNAADDLAIAASGAFAFATKIASGAPYAVTVKTQPAAPWQTCTPTSGTGNVAGGNVTSVQVGCTTNQYKVGGTVSGLTGKGLTLTVNGAGTTAVQADGTFTFPTNIASGTAYTVAIATQPSGPTQTCTLANGAGTIAGANVTNVAVTCKTNSYAIGGTVSGLNGGGLVITNNGGDAITLASGATAFTFATPIASGLTYNVQVATQPGNPAQTCSVNGGQGTVVAGAITSIAINCATNSYSLGGSVSGLVGSGLVLKNGATSLNVSANGSFAFATAIPSGASYAVAVGTQPSGPTQVCTVSAGSGTMGNTNVSNVVVTCTTSSFTIGGTVSGLAGSGLVVRDNGGDDHAITANGAFTFATAVKSGAAYAVTVLTQPTGPSQTCTVTSGAGTVGAGNVTTVAINCQTNSYTVGGTVTGLAGTGLALTLNGANATTITANGAFTFATQVASGAAYAVAIQTQPSNATQVCTVTGGSGTIAGANVNVAVNCVTQTFTIGGRVAGLNGTGLVLTNGNDKVAVPVGVASFVFPTAVASGQTYNVVIATQPGGQTCSISGNTGTVGASNVTSVVVNCTTLYTISGTVAGLQGTGLVLADGVDKVAVSGTSFAFPTGLANGTAYTISVAANPATQTCIVANATGTIAGANVTSIAVRCINNSYTLSVSVKGLLGKGLTVNDSFDNVNPAQDGTYAFVKLQAGTKYTITIAGQPQSPWQTCAVTSGATGVIAGDTTVPVVCTTNTYVVSVAVTGGGNSCADLTLDDSVSSMKVTFPSQGTSTFDFTPALASGTSYRVTFTSTDSLCRCNTPLFPNGTASGGIGSGTITSANVSYPITCYELIP